MLHQVDPVDRPCFGGQTVGQVEPASEGAGPEDVTNGLVLDNLLSAVSDCEVGCDCGGKRYHDVYFKEVKLVLIRENSGVALFVEADSSHLVWVFVFLVRLYELLTRVDAVLESHEHVSFIAIGNTEVSEI